MIKLKLFVIIFSSDSINFLKNETNYNPFDTSIKIEDNLVVNYVSVNDHNDLMVSYVG